MQSSQVLLVAMYSSGEQEKKRKITTHLRSVHRNGAQESPATGFVGNCPLEMRVKLMTESSSMT